MAIKLKSISVEKYIVSDTGKKLRVGECSLKADTSAEVIAIGDNGDTVDGLEPGEKMTMGSTCFCADGSFGVLNSSGTWKF